MTDHMQIARDIPALTAILQHRGGRRLVLVPTMGALHDGHLSLIDRARAHGDLVAASIFVNPTQFDQSQDLSRYPRDEAGDLVKLEQAGCHIAWVPDVRSVYPDGDCTRIHLDGPALGFEGDLRPGHFSGVATVVCKLFGQFRPDAAVFGEKDWQQLQVVRRLTTDLNLGVEIVGAPIMRAPDGLALSSRNVFLTPDQRAQAPHLIRTLEQAARRLTTGIEQSVVMQDSIAHLTASGFTVDYFAHIDGPTLAPTARVTPRSRLIAAARLGSVRLLDNIAVR